MLMMNYKSLRRRTRRKITNTYNLFEFFEKKQNKFQNQTFFEKRSAKIDE